MVERRVAVKVDADVSPFVRGLTTAGVAAKGFARELESADSRMANLVQAGLALAPALVPLGAAAVPAIAGLVTQLGFAAGAAGVTVLAFQGVGDALKALNDYQIAPTAEHFAKLQQTMDALGPAGQEFVLAMQDLRPQLQGLQDIAQQGLLPGATEGINELMDLMPQAEQMIGTFASTIGNLLAEAGDNLNDPRWVEFFSFLDREAGPTLTAMGKTLGNVVEGLANMMMAFNPLANDFTAGMLHMSQAFNEWTQGLDSSEGFQNFVDYVRQSGPQAMDTLAALADALVSLLRAAAPVGQVVLPIITDLAHALGALADSPVGPLLIGTAAAIGTLGRSMALLKAVGLMGGGESIFGRILGVDKIKAGATALGTVTTATERATLSAQKLQQVEKERAATARAGIAQFGKSAALVGGLALATSGLADKTDLSNTASLALMGTIAGPWGTAIGGGVGLAMDLAAANNNVEEAMRAANAAARMMAVDFTSQHAVVTDLQAKTEDYAASVQRGSGFITTSWSGVGDKVKMIGDLFTHTQEESSKATHQQIADFLALRQGAAEFYAALNNGDLSMLNATDEELTKFATQIAPALQKAGLDIRDVLLTHNGWDVAVAAVQDYNASMDSVSGRSKAVGAAMADLASEMESNVTQADALKSALDALFGVEMNQSQATDQAIVALKGMREEVAKAGKALLGNSDAALKARDGIRGYVQAQLDKVSADAAAGVSGDKLVNTLVTTRNNVIAAAKAAGVGEKGIRELVKSMGLTPKNLRTMIETPGLMTAKQQVQALGKLYHLTPKEVRTMLNAIDHGKTPTQALKGLYDKLDGRQVKTLVSALTDVAQGKLAAFSRAFNGLDGRVARAFVQVTTQHIDTRLGPIKQANGSVMEYFANGAENHVAQIAPAGAWRVWAEPETGGEAYIPLAASKRDRSLDIWRAVGDRLGVQFQEFATGGISHFATGGIARNGGVNLDIQKLTVEISKLHQQLAKGGKDALTGNDRRLKEIELKQKQQDIRDKRQGAYQDRRDALAKELDDLRQAISSFDVTSSLPGDHSPRNPVTAGVRGEIDDFKKSIREAGGEWTKHLQHLAESMLRNAHSIDVHDRALDRETKRRDKLAETLANEQQAMEQLQSTMTAFSQSVAGNFNGSPFGKSYTVTEQGAADPVLQGRLAARQDQLSAAQAELAGIRSSATGDSGANSARASVLIQQIAGMQSEVDGLAKAVEDSAQPVERTVSGLQAMREQLLQNTQDAIAFSDALKTLSAEGLNSDLFAQLATSGDLGTAQELVSGGMSAVEDINQLWNDRAAAAAQVAAFATQQVYGAQQAILQAQINAQNALIKAADGNIRSLNAEIKTLGTRVENGAEKGVRSLQGQLQDIKQAISNIPRETGEQKKKARV